MSSKQKRSLYYLQVSFLKSAWKTGLESALSAFYFLLDKYSCS